MRKFKTVIKEDASFALVPHSEPHHSKIIFNDEHVGTVHTVMRLQHKAVGPSVIATRFHVKAPEGFSGPYTEKDCNTMDEAKRHAFTQHQLGTMTWKN